MTQKEIDAHYSKVLEHACEVLRAEAPQGELPDFDAIAVLVSNLEDDLAELFCPLDKRAEIMSSGT